MQPHSVSAVRLPDLARISLASVSVATDADSIGWTLSASGPVDLLTTLAAVDGAPVRMRLTVDGMAWDLVVDALRRDRSFGRVSASVTARSPSSLLGAPYAGPKAWLNAVPMTAQQIVVRVLDGTDLALDWGVTDWTVPAGALSITDTPIGVVRHVADAAGAVVRSARAGDVLAIAPRYPLPPWQWDTAAPDVTIALGAVEVEGYERADQPAYDGVYVSGQAQGVLALVKRAGSGPTATAALVTHPLLTHVDACRQRGLATLGAAGAQARMTLTLPVHTGPGDGGLIDVGALVAVADPSGPWRGMVRSTALGWDGATAKLRQTITLERHL